MLVHQRVQAHVQYPMYLWIPLWSPVASFQAPRCQGRSRARCPNARWAREWSYQGQRKSWPNTWGVSLNMSGLCHGSCHTYDSMESMDCFLRFSTWNHGYYPRKIEGCSKMLPCEFLAASIQSTTNAGIAIPNMGRWKHVKLQFHGAYYGINPKSGDGCGTSHGDASLQFKWDLQQPHHLATKFSQYIQKYIAMV